MIFFEFKDENKTKYIFFLMDKKNRNVLSQKKRNVDIPSWNIFFVYTVLISENIKLSFTEKFEETFLHNWNLLQGSPQSCQKFYFTYRILYLYCSLQKLNILNCVQWKTVPYKYRYNTRFLNVLIVAECCRTAPFLIGTE